MPPVFLPPRPRLGEGGWGGEGQQQLIAMQSFMNFASSINSGGSKVKILAISPQNIAFGIQERGVRGLVQRLWGFSRLVCTP